MRKLLLAKYLTTSKLLVFSCMRYKQANDQANFQMSSAIMQHTTGTQHGATFEREQHNFPNFTYFNYCSFYGGFCKDNYMKTRFKLNKLWKSIFKKI